MENRNESNPFTYEVVQDIANGILSQISKHKKPEVLIICGSGLAGLVDDIQDPESVEYSNINGFPQGQHVAGHGSKLVFGTIAGKTVVAMQGRFHFYQGYTMYQVTLPIRVARLMGCTKMVVTNAAGGLNQTFKVGTIMVIDDHLNFPGMAGYSPLRGDNDDRWGPRFPPINNAYDLERNSRLIKCAEKMGLGQYMRRGCYVLVAGPSYESPAECVWLGSTGNDAVGMSTVPEVITAHHCGMEIIGMSLITNIAILDKNNPTVANHEEVLEVGQQRGKDMRALIAEFFKEW